MRTKHEVLDRLERIRVSLTDLKHVSNNPAIIEHELEVASQLLLEVKRFVFLEKDTSDL